MLVNLKASCCWPVAVCAMALLGAMTCAQRASAQLAYDGFAAGGAAPNAAAGQYETGTGFPDDFILGQAPTTLGFAGTGWTATTNPFVGTVGAPLNPSAPSYADFVYHRAENAQMSYVDANNRMLDTTPGQVHLFRDQSMSTSGKQISRDLNIGTSLPDTLYVSMLTQVTTGAELNVQMTSTNGGNAGNSNRPFLFGINEDGNPYVIGTSTSGGGAITKVTDTNAGIVIDENAAHLLVAKLTHNGTTLDQIDLYLDPLLESEASNSPVASVAFGNWYVSNNVDWTIGDIFFDNLNPETGFSVFVDEIRIGSTFESVTPNSEVVPEPASLAVWSLLGVGLLGYGVWRQRSR